MNLLAHALIAWNSLPDSGGQEVCGAVMADYFGGQDLDNYPPGIVAGIRQHRAVDAWTDAHPAFISCRRLLAENGAPRFASGILVDLFWDHVLGSNWKSCGRPHSGLDLEEFCAGVNRRLVATAPWHSPQFRRVMPWMVKDGWLAAYATMDGIAAALQGLSRRLPHGAPLSGCERFLVAHERELAAGFAEFWGEIWVWIGMDRLSRH